MDCPSPGGRDVLVAPGRRPQDVAHFIIALQPVLFLLCGDGRPNMNQDRASAGSPPILTPINPLQA
ncbi:hypothetical protein TSH100_00120 [Azospirillum sp. TSH100]|nr:hypothetical protein TSH100_00120 [Azospirillum sp. TSH100]